jgi:hypothetical protein
VCVCVFVGVCRCVGVWVCLCGGGLLRNLFYRLKVYYTTSDLRARFCSKLVHFRDYKKFIVCFLSLWPYL